MDQLIFTIYDEKAEVFLPPLFVTTKGIALRAFTDALNSPEHQFGKHPQDYTLFFLGKWEDGDASFNIKAKTSIGNGVEFLQTPKLEYPYGPEHPPIQPDKEG